ncbi:MAG: hypothetical protein IPJ76_08365 [Flavobacteriales bacterium]|nr:MAG: hypothetical protein IPJ76_08365 [Flavobacteriales bacterium]
METAEDREQACRTMERHMLEARRKSKAHSHEKAVLEAMAKDEEALMLQCDLRAERLRMSILDIEPNWMFGSEAEASEQTVGSTTEKEVQSEHKRRYGVWSAVALKALSDLGSGTFQEISRHVRTTDFNYAFDSDADMEGLRGALHGLAKRDKNKRVKYEKGANGSGGTFTYINDEQQ